MLSLNLLAEVSTNWPTVAVPATVKSARLFAIASPIVTLPSKIEVELILKVL